QQVADIHIVSGLYQKLPQNSFFPGDDAKVRDGRAILGKTGAEINSKVEQLVAEFDRRIAGNIAAFDRSGGHVGIDFGKPQFKQHNDKVPIGARSIRQAWAGRTWIWEGRGGARLKPG